MNPVQETAQDLIPPKDVDLEGGEDAPPDPLEKVANFLKQIPPDWEAAEKHGRANLVVDSSKTVLQLDEDGTYCPCCQLPYVEDDQLYPICVDNSELGELGPGFPLFF